MNLGVVLAYIAAVVAAGVALVWLAFKHQTVAHWSFGAGMLLLAADTALGGLAVGLSASGTAMSWQPGRAWCAALLPGVWLVYGLSYSRGNYREFLRGWRWAIGGAFLAPVLLVTAFGSGLMGVESRAAGEGGQFIPLGWAGKVLEVLVLSGMLLALINLEKTFRSALGWLRWQVKFMVLGVAVMLGGRMYASSQALLFSGIQLSLVGVLAASLLVGTLLVTFSLIRTGCRETDVYPSRAMLYGSLSVMLAGAYLLLVGLLAEAVTRLGGDRMFPIKSLFLLLAIAGLGVLLLSDRFRQRTQLFISRHFRRSVHDYRRIWTAFTAHTAGRLDRTEYCHAVVTRIAETFNAMSVTIWMVEPGQQRLQFGASTAPGAERGGGVMDLGDVGADWIADWRKVSDPVDLDTAREPRVQALRQRNPESFRRRGNRVGLPLVAGGEVQGFILVADPVSRGRFTIEDRELLKCIGDQVAAALRNIQLSGKLIEAKELEAFQSMSAFFVHDLKNTASTLSMMLHNLPTHFDNAEFRADALRGIGKSVDRLNGLVERLTLLRQGLAVNLAAADVNDLVRAAVGQIEGTPGLEVACDLELLPRLPVDSEQFPKTLTNLLFNAREAVGDHGQIRVMTRRRDGYAVISVADNGCGMSAEFLRWRLFRPFQTTKKKGLGIGMFQSKMIVEAHGGRMEVESQPGEGTEFRVFLPFAPAK